MKIRCELFLALVLNFRILLNAIIIFRDELNKKVSKKSELKKQVFPDLGRRTGGESRISKTYRNVENAKIRWG